MNQPMASYLATAMIGHYRITNTTDGGRPVVTAVDSSLPTSYDATLARTAEVVSFLEKFFGPYPFDAEGGIVQADRQFGFALENQSRPVYSAGLLHRARATNTGVLAHELAHQWFGDSLSVASWNDAVAERGLRDLRGVAVVRAQRRRAGEARSSTTPTTAPTAAACRPVRRAS